MSEKSRFTNDNIYWLTIGDQRGQRIEVCDSAPDSTFPIVKRSIYKRHFEKNELYNASIPNGEEEDHWFWQKFTAPNRYDINFFLDHVVTVGSLPAKFAIELRGVSHTQQNPDHHTQIYINNNLVLDLKWDGQAKKVAKVEIPQGYFKEGKNILSIEQPNDIQTSVDVILLNWFRVEYWRDHISRNNFCGFWGKDIPGFFHYEINELTADEILVYDITDSSHVRKFINFRYENYASTRRLTFQDSATSRHYLAISPQHIRKPAAIEKDRISQLRSPNNQADYLIITHKNFEQTIATLANYRQRQGLRVVTICVDDIYDEFNYGIKNPATIKEFLRYAYFNWLPPAPTYVLLVGDASYDFKKFQATSYADLMPTHLFISNTLNFETSSDNWFVCLQGNDNLPEMLIGRLPARSRVELEKMIEKIINYENQPTNVDWNKSIKFISDNSDVAGEFELVFDSFIHNYIPDNFDIFRIYLRDYGDVDFVRYLIKKGMNEGCLIANYIGHGAIKSWARENIFNNNDVPSLTNFNMLPLVISFSCLNGFFHHAVDSSCLAEELLKFGNGGAVASFFSSGYNYTAADQHLGNGIYSALFKDYDRLLGSAMLKGKIELFSLVSDFFDDHIDFYNLLGDPALKLNLPDLSYSVEPQWNLISLPRLPKNTSIDSVLKSLQGKWSKIMTYKNNRWLGADASIPAEFWTLKELEVGRGYWLETNSEGDFTVNGSEKANLILLSPGWNLIGYPAASRRSVSSALNSLEGNWEKILHFQENRWIGADANLSQQFWTLEELRPGSGYWLKVTNPDTLIFSRIPTFNDEPPDPLQSTNGNAGSPLRKIQGKKTTPFMGAASDDYFKLTVPKPSGYFGKVYVRNMPAPKGTRISAWINGQHIPPEVSVSENGKYNLFLVAGDDPETSVIEGAENGSEIIFKIHLPTGEIFQSDTRGIWEEAINHHLNLFALSDSDSLKTPLKIQIRVNNKIVSQDIIQGDPIPADATIFIDVLSDEISLSKENVKLSLDDQNYPEKDYKCEIQNTQSSSQFHFSIPAKNFSSGFHTLKTSVQHPALFPNTRYSEFSFRICNQLNFEKVVNFPNPMQNDTKFTYVLLNDGVAEVTIKIYTISGRLIKTINGAAGEVGYNETYWDGTDEFGDAISNGVYFYKIIANDGEKKIEHVEKLVKIQ